MDMQIEGLMAGKTAVISGAGRGIGRAAAKLFARAGARVVLNARTRSDLEALAEQIQQQGGQATVFSGDVSRWSDMQALGEMISEKYGAADVVVANAGRLDPVGDSWLQDPQDWQDNIAVNLTGSFFLARACLPAMVSQKSGVLVFVSSGVATHPLPGWSAYCAAKAGVDHLVRTLASEMDQHKLSLRVHGMYPGVVDTTMQAHIRQIPASQFPLVEKYLQYQQQDQLRPPEEPGALILWLASHFAADLQGRVVSIRDMEFRNRLAADFGIQPFPQRR